MANLFLANLVQFGDRPGLGAYEVGHFLQHQQYLNILAGSNVILPDYNILRMGGDDPQRWLGENANEFSAWLNDHEAIHEFLRAQTNVSGFGSLAFLDQESPDSWNLWQQNHADEHRQFDAHFKTT
jgi:hypothetical protein